MSGHERFPKGKAPSKSRKCAEIASHLPPGKHSGPKKNQGGHLQSPEIACERQSPGVARKISAQETGISAHPSDPQEVSAVTDKLSHDQRQVFLARMIPTLPTNPAATLDEVGMVLPDTPKQKARVTGWTYDYRGRPIQEVTFKYPPGDPPRPEWAEDIQDWESPRGHFVEGCTRLGLKQDDTFADLLRALGDEKE